MFCSDKSNEDDPNKPADQTDPAKEAFDNYVDQLEAERDAGQLTQEEFDRNI